MAGLDEILKSGPNGTVPKAELSIGGADDSELPEPGSPYQAHARAANKPVYTLHCLKGKEGVFSFQFVNLDSHSEFHVGEEGQVITLRFAGTKIWELTITGLKLWRCYDLIHQHRMPWVRRSDRGFSAVAADGETVIFGIEIKDVTPKE